MSTYDPYDIWKTRFGFGIKDFYNRHRWIGIPAAVLLTIFDTYLNGRQRFFCQRQEYPIVRAWAALILLNEYQRSGAEWTMEHIRDHLNWLYEHSCRGYSGPCWGLNFNYAVNAEFIYDTNMPLTTMTPYVLEAFVRYTEISGDDRYVPVIRGIYEFLENDIEIMEETDEYLITSYAAMRDRCVVNAVSYVMFSYSLLLPYLDGEKFNNAEAKIRKLYAYIALMQGLDGSWMYSPEGNSFIDCFHSCLILKNLIKVHSNKYVQANLTGCDERIKLGYEYLKENLFVADAGLFRRFSVANKLSLVRFDLYDNAEMLNLAGLLGDLELTRSLERNIQAAFVRGDDIYSQIDCFGLRHGKNTLRWAVMPYLYAQSLIDPSAMG